MKWRLVMTLAHVSDLHVGERWPDPALAGIAAALEQADVDLVLVTGDVTHRGRLAELAAFERAFAGLRRRLVVVPGNHDRLGEDAARRIMPGARVSTVSRPGLHVVRLDSTAPHNRALLASHGLLTAEDADAVDAAVEAAPPGALVVLMLHHHLLPLPEDAWYERLSSWAGLPLAAELPLGRALVDRLRGRCELVVHGHRHAAGEVVLPGRAGGRPLRILNAGSTPELGRLRLLYATAGRVVAERWLEVHEPGAGVAPPVWAGAGPELVPALRGAA